MVGDVARFAAEWSAAQTLLRFYRALDAGDYPACVACFATDGRWHRLGAMADGAEAIAAALAARLPAVVVRHVVSNVVAELTDDDRVAVSASSLAFAHNFGTTTPTVPATLADPIGLWSLTATVVRIDDSWLIASLDMTAQMLRPPSSTAA